MSGTVRVGLHLCVIKNSFLEICHIDESDLEDYPLGPQMMVRQYKTQGRNKRSHSQPCSRMLPDLETGISRVTTLRISTPLPRVEAGFRPCLSKSESIAPDLGVPEGRTAPFATAMMDSAVASKTEKEARETEKEQLLGSPKTMRSRPPKSRRLHARRLAELLFSAASEAQETFLRETQNDFLLSGYALEILERLRMESKGICTKCAGTGKNFFGKPCCCGAKPPAIQF